MKTTAERKPVEPGPGAGAAKTPACDAVTQPTDQISLRDAPEAIFDLRRVPFPPEFAYGARNAVATCLHIHAGEKVTLITDDACLQIAASIATELEALGCEWNAFVLEALASRPLAVMPGLSGWLPR